MAAIIMRPPPPSYFSPRLLTLPLFLCGTVFFFFLFPFPFSYSELLTAFFPRLLLQYCSSSFRLRFSEVSLLASESESEAAAEDGRGASSSSSLTRRAFALSPYSEKEEAEKGRLPPLTLSYPQGVFSLPSVAFPPPATPAASLYTIPPRRGEDPGAAWHTHTHTPTKKREKGPSSFRTVSPGKRERDDRKALSLSSGRPFLPHAQSLRRRRHRFVTDAQDTMRVHVCGM